LIEIINKLLLLQLVGYLCYWQMGFNSVFKGLKKEISESLHWANLSTRIPKLNYTIRHYFILPKLYISTKSPFRNATSALSIHFLFSFLIFPTSVP